MDDLISRQAAIDAFAKELSAEHNHREMAVSFLGAKKIIEAVPSAEPEQRWIPVSERLPEPYSDVILTIRGTDMIKVLKGETLEQALKRNSQIYWVTTGYLADVGWNGLDGFPLIVKPIAWCGFPEPWKGEEDA